ncbi:UNVERIFIED_CONTAM: Transcription elongation factor A protein 2 [Trichonephila clavipes]
MKEQSLDLLKALRDLPITLDILQKTRIGMTVNSLRKSSNDDEVITLSKILIKAWKKLLPETPNSKGDGNGNGRESKGENSNGSTASSQSQKNEGSRDSSSKKESKPSAPKQTSFPADTTNAVRLKCREMLAGALKLDGIIEPAKIAVMTADVQTRSADEPMTTFVYCNECGNRWKIKK